MKDFLNLDESLFTSMAPEGFIEIIALDELDKIIGGFLNSDELDLILPGTDRVLAPALVRSQM